MIVFACPNPACRKRYKAADDQAGKTITCRNPSCGLRIQVPHPPPKPAPVPGDLIDEETGAVIRDWRDEQPPEEPLQRRREPEPEDDEPYHPRSGGAGNLAVPTLIGAVLGAVVMAPPAVFLSQYWPVFGGVLEKALAQPWSPVRVSLIPTHLFVFCFVGVVLGGVAGLLLSLQSTRRRRRDTEALPRKSSSAGVWGLILGITLPICVVLGFSFLFLLALHSGLYNNARCPLCGREFHIPEEHRGNIAQWTRHYSCPNCGQSWPPGMLYKKKEKE